MFLNSQKVFLSEGNFNNLPLVHSLKLQESASTRLIRLNSERSRTNSSLANRILPNELLQPAANFEKEFNDTKLVNDFKLVGSQVTGSSQQKEANIPPLRKERRHAKSFNQKRMAFFKEGYTYFPMKDQSSHAATEIENSNAKQGPVVAPLYSWDEVNYRNTPAIMKQ